MSIDVTISIVNWNTRDELRACLECVFSQNDASTFEVVVVDNASRDGSADMVKSEFGDRVELISNDTNRGFGAAHNQAIHRSIGRFVLILNPDSHIAEPDAVAKMIRYMDANPRVGLLGPKILHPDGSLQYSARRFPPMLAGAFRHTFLGRLFPKNRFVREYMMTDWAHNQVRDVDWLSGSALLARRETIGEIGLFDEGFFMYVEDVDWCRRAHQAGWRVVYYPMTTVTHRIGASSDQNPVEMIRQHHRSMLRYYLKYDVRGPKALLAPFVILALWLRQRSLIRRVRPRGSNSDGPEAGAASS